MLSIGPGVQVVFQGTSQLEVDGTLLAHGSAASPVVFNMIQGGLQSKFFLNGGTANIVNAKFVGGIFLSKDSQLALEGSDLTQGSGIYLQGVNTATIKSCKIYGNATGLVSDGKNKISMNFNTIVQNTYGLFLKSFGELEFHNNSIHDNQVEVINNTPAYKLSGNFWGSMDEKAVMSKIQGSINLQPMKSLKDVLRVYVQTQLPEITQEMSDAMAAKERRQEKADKLALKKLKEQEGLEALQEKKEKEAQEKAVASGVSSSPAVPQPAVSQPALPQPVEATAPAAEESVAPELETSAASGTVKVKALPAAPHQLTPVVLPPDQGDLAQSAAAPPPANMETAPVASTAPPVPEVPANNAASSSPAPPVIPDMDLMAPPPPSVESVPLPPVNDSVASTQPAPVVNNVPAGSVSAPSTDNGEIPPPPSIDSNTNVPAPAAPAVLAPPAAADIVPPPSIPDTSSAVPAPPVPALATTAPLTVPTPDQPTADQKKAMDALQGVNGDIDGMQAPPLDLGVGLSAPATNAAPAPGQAAPAPDDSNLALPPLQDSDVKPPKDLDLPPTDDLGNVNLDSRNK